MFSRSLKKSSFFKKNRSLSHQNTVLCNSILLRAFSELLICMLHQFGLGCIKNGALRPIRNVPYVPIRNGPKRYPAVPNASTKYSPMAERTRRIEDRRTAPNA